MKRLEHWKQDTPQEQVVVLLQSVQGHLMNMMDGRGNKIKQQDLMYKALEEAQMILRKMSDTSKWEP